MKEKLNYLNVGCGKKYHKEWVNIDMVSSSKDVIACNLLKGIPYPDNTFDVVYHSQVLEHIPKNEALFFIKECYRVLKPNGILRVVLPDLENIVDEYKRFLTQCRENPTAESEANYEWMVLEMYDQTIRNENGGMMSKFLQQKEMINEEYVLDRIGFVGKNIRGIYLEGKGKTSVSTKIKELGFINFVFKALGIIKQRILGFLFGRKYRIGDFRLGGEIHYWMYDSYSLSILLKKAGFSETTRKTPIDSDIKDWGKYELDVKDGQVYDPTSLFMEARK